MKVSPQHAVAINKLMLTVIASMARGNTDETDFGMLRMYAGDVAHNAAALKKFNTSRDALKLHDDIMHQDTLPRERCYSVLRYIEQNALIPTNRYACVLP